MGAYNWIDIQGVCPNCKKPATIRIQFHYAASFGGDERGMFHGRWYRIGDTLMWYEPSDPEFGELNEVGFRDDAWPGRVLECAYAACMTCKAELFALLAFENLVLTEVLQFGLEREWPRRYLR